jgi:hypothetical protein
MFEIAKIRLASQRIAASGQSSAREVVGWMGAMQAQDYAMAKWAVGIRIPNARETDVDAAINAGEIFRIHLLRPTWHFVSADDIHWMLALTAPHIKASLKSRHSELGLSEADFIGCRRAIEKALGGGRHLTREALFSELERENIAADYSHAYHLVVEAELDGILCSGAAQNGKPTYALLEERCPKPQPVPRVEALARLAHKYFSSHGPATLRDFIWWSGLPTRDARQALEIVKAGLMYETSDSQTYWFSGQALASSAGEHPAVLLPAYDEFIISYADRGASLSDLAFKQAISSNGIFRPVIVVDGIVAGLWKRSQSKSKVVVEMQLFQPADNIQPGDLEKAASAYSRFLDKRLEIR